MAILEIDKITHRFGGLLALDRVSFAVRPGQIKAVIGPNGAGKTTLFNVVSGILRPTAGEIRLNGGRINGLPPHRIAALGVARTFQNLSLFPRMTVIENVMLGRHCRSKGEMLACALSTTRQRNEEKTIRERAAAYLDFVGLSALADIPVGALPFGSRRMVELARALASEPTLLLLDEPGSGLNTREKDDLGELIARIRERGVTVLLVEHDMSLVMDISDEIVVLDHGSLIAEGKPGAIRTDPRVISVYLGGDLENAAG
ncbi:MAG: ABC transporter ATP-binding protein [Kiritimatiellae bacterium]|nr:ABC transporter ATP-binding protein [Kiritimatiellia bacterium]